MEDVLQEGEHATSDPVMLHMQFQMAACVHVYVCVCLCVCVYKCMHARECMPVYFDLTTMKIP